MWSSPNGTTQQCASCRCQNPQNSNADQCKPVINRCLGRSPGARAIVQSCGPAITLRNQLRTGVDGVKWPRQLENALPALRRAFPVLNSAFGDNARLCDPLHRAQFPPFGITIKAEQRFLYRAAVATRVVRRQMRALLTIKQLHTAGQAVVRPLCHARAE